MAASAPIFTHDDLDVLDAVAIGDAGDGVHEQRLAERRAPPRLALQVDRRGHVHERQRDELGESTRLVAARHALRTMCRAQCIGCSMAPNMIVMFERRPTEWAVRWASSHSSVFTLSGQRVARISSSRISAAVPGQRLETGGHQSPQVVGERLAEPLGALGHLEGGETVDVDRRATASRTASMTSR